MKALLRILIFFSFSVSGEQLDYSHLRFISVDESPANYLDESGKLSGFVTEIIKHLQNKLQIDTEIEVLPEARAIRTLDTFPNVIMFSISRSPAREHKYHWLAHVLSKRWIFFSKSEFPYDLTSISQLINTRSVGVIRGDIREDWLREKKITNLTSVLDYNKAVEMLIRGRFELLFYESFGVYTTLKTLGYESDIVKSQLIATESDVYIVMSKSTGDASIVKELQNQLTQLKNSDWYRLHLNTWVKKLNAEGVADAWIAHGVLKY